MSDFAKLLLITVSIFTVVCFLILFIKCSGVNQISTISHGQGSVENTL